MREIIATVIASINCIACIALTLWHILTLPNKLQNSPDEGERKKAYDKACKRWELSLMLTTVIDVVLLWKGGLKLVAEDIFYTILAVVALIFMILFRVYHQIIEKKYNTQRYSSSQRKGNLGGGTFFGATLVMSVYQIVLLFLQ